MGCCTDRKESLQLTGHKSCQAQSAPSSEAPLLCPSSCALWKNNQWDLAVLGSVQHGWLHTSLGHTAPTGNAVACGEAQLHRTLRSLGSAKSCIIFWGECKARKWLRGMSSPVCWNLCVCVCIQILFWFINVLTELVRQTSAAQCYSAVGPARHDIDQRTTKWKMGLQSNVNLISEIMCCSIAVLSGFVVMSLLEIQLWNLTPLLLTAKTRVHCRLWKADSVWLSNISIQGGYIKHLWYLLTWPYP